MNLRELVNTAFAVIVSSLETKEEVEEFNHELYAEPGQKFVPLSRGTNKLMALFQQQTKGA